MIPRLFLGQLYPGDKFELRGIAYTVDFYDSKNRKIIVNNDGRTEKFDRMEDVRVAMSTWDSRRLDWYQPDKDSLKK